MVKWSGRFTYINRCRAGFMRYRNLDPGSCFRRHLPMSCLPRLENELIGPASGASRASTGSITFPECLHFFVCVFVLKNSDEFGASNTLLYN